MRTTPFQRALDRLEDRIFRLPAPRRRACIQRTRTALQRSLPSDYRRTTREERRRLATDGQVYPHHAMVAFVDQAPAMRDRCLVSVAQAQGLWLWWLPFLLIWNSLTSGIDVFEYALSWYLGTRRWCPRGLLAPALATTALICADVRRQQAAGARVPSWCLAWQHMPVSVVKVCAWRIGILRGWQRPARDAAQTPDPPDWSFFPGALRAALACLALWAILHPDPVHAGVLTATISSSTLWQVQTNGSDTNGGGYSSGGTDYSQQAAAQVSVTNAVTNGTTTITSATANFTSVMVGNVCYVQGGTGAVTAGWYQVVTFTNSTTIVVDRSTGLTAGTGVTLHLGGALVSPGQAAAVRVGFNIVYVKAGTYSITSASTNIAGGCVSDSAAGAGVAWEGFQATRGDLGTAPVWQASGISTATLLTCGTANTYIVNLAVDGASLTAIRGCAAATTLCVSRCQALNCTNGGIARTGGVPMFLRCLATGCSTAGTGIDCIAAFLLGGEAYSNTVSGFNVNQSAVTYCIASGNSGGTSNGFITGGSPDLLANLTAYGNGQDGFGVNSMWLAINAVAEANTRYGFNGNTGAGLENCAGYSNTSGNTNGTFAVNRGFITGTASFFVNPAAGNFALNTAAGGGALLRAAGYPGPYLRGLTTGYEDIGAAQHADAGGGYAGGVYGA